MDWFRNIMVLLVMRYFMVIDVWLNMSHFMMNDMRLDIRLLVLMLVVLWDRCENKWLINHLVRDMMDIMLQDCRF